MATTINQLRRELLVEIRDTDEEIDTLLNQTIRDINVAARTHRNSPARFENAIVVAITAFWSAYRLLSVRTNRNVAQAFVTYVDNTIGARLLRVGATETIQRLATAEYADDVARGILRRKSLYDNKSIEQRIVTIRRGNERVVADLLKNGIDRNLSINQVARSIQDYVKPARVTRGNAINYKTIQAGKKIPKGSINYNAVRIARTEIMQTYDQASRNYYDGQPWAKGWDWFLSNTHAVQDQCDILAAQSPHEKLPARPHPQCTCDPQPRVATLKEFGELVKSGIIV